MTTRVDFFHWRSNLRLAKLDRKNAKKVYKKLIQVRELQEELKQAYNNKKADELQDLLEDLMAALQKESYFICQIHQDGTKQEYDLRKDIKELYELIQKNANPDKIPEISQKDVETWKQKLTEINKDLTKDMKKMRNEAADAENARHYFVKYSNLMGAMHTAQVLARLEKHVKKEKKIERKELKGILHHEKQLQKHAKDMVNKIEELAKESENLSHQITQAEHEDILLYYNLMAEAENVRNWLIQLKQSKYPQDKMNTEEEHLTRLNETLKDAVEKMENLSNFAAQDAQMHS